MSASQKLSNWIEILGDLLVDPDHVTWSVASLTNFINTALAALSSARPDAFTKEVRITLAPGTDQVLPEGVISVVGRPSTLCVGPAGTVTVGAVASAVDNNTVVAFSRFNQCAVAPPAINTALTTEQTAIVAKSGVTAKCSDWAIAGFVFDPRTPTILSVTPPVPAGVTPTLKLSLQTCPPYYDWKTDMDMELVCRHREVLLEYILMMAYDTESESELAMQRAQVHWSRFQALLGFNYRMQSRFGSGYFAGKKPDGTPDEAVIRG